MTTTRINPYDTRDPAGAQRGGGDSQRVAGLLDAVLGATQDQDGAPRRVEAERGSSGGRSLEAALRWYLRLNPGGPPPAGKAQLMRRINGDIAAIDRVLGRQLNAVLHHPRFQKLEASWRGLQYLTRQLDPQSHVHLRVLNVSWSALLRDFDRAIEFDQSQLFRKVYSQEFGTSGGEPFSVLLGDYSIRRQPQPGAPTDDIEGLRQVSQVAAAAFCPFIASVDPTMFGLDSFGELERPMDLRRIFRQPEYIKWRRLREAEDSRFLGLTLPRILMRLPYRNDGSRADAFTFEEDVAGEDASKYLWGAAVYAFGAVLLRAFRQSGWLADIRGVRQDADGGGLAPGLPTPFFRTDRPGIAARFSTDFIISPELEHDLCQLGFLPLCVCPDGDAAAFYSNSSIQLAKKFDSEFATANAKISSMLQYLLCVSRVAHFVKVIGRAKVGSFLEPSQCESFLNEWLHRYVMQNDDATAEIKAKYPLRDANVQVRAYPGKPGSYYCIIRMQPHFQFDELATSIQLTTELTPAAPG
ncbi:MAG: type VI secretion system contractile sheath large subunit [Pirellulaceae bacterium]